MIYLLQKTAVLALMLGLSLEIRAGAISDNPIIAIEPGLEVDGNMLGGKLGWVDSSTLLVTARISADSKFWERKVVSVDVRTGEAKELVNPGALVCTNPTESVAGIMVGSEASIYTGNSKEPKPELQLFSWSSRSGTLTQKIPGDSWNPYICKETKPKDTKVPGSLALYKESDIRYLETKDGYLRLLKDQRGEHAGVALIRNGQEVAVLQAKFTEIAPEPQYLPFRGEYLLSSGRFVMGGTTMARSNETPTTEYPLLTMSKAGSVKREYFRPLFERSGLNADGQTFPYANGTMIFVSSRPKHGGGIYLAQGESIERVWCINAGNTFDRQCRATTISMSPDGCHFAFFSESSDNMRSPRATGAALKILPLCN